MPARSRWAAALVAIAALLGGAARLGTVDWGHPHLLHVDEKGFVMMEAASIEFRGLSEGDWRPRTTTYGPVLYGVALGLKWLFLGGLEEAERQVAAHPAEWPYVSHGLQGGDDAPFDFLAWAQLARGFGALFATLGLLMLARAAWLLRGPEAAVATAWVAAASVGMIQHAHFFTSDALVVGEAGFFLHACALLARRRRWAGAYAGIVLGGILATKMTGGLLLAVVPVAIGAAGPSPSPSREREGGSDSRARGRAGVGGGPLSAGSWWARGELRRILAALATVRFLGVVAVALGVYALLCPWGVFERDVYTDVPGNRSGLEVLRTQYTEREYAFYDWRFTYNDTTDYLYVLEAVLPYAMGALALLAAGLGVLLAFRRGGWPERIAAMAAVPTFLLVGHWGVKTIRYVVPALPGLCLAAGFVLARGWKAGPLGKAAAALVVAATVGWGAIYTAALLEDDPRVQAGRWLAAHAEPGDVVVVEPEDAYTAVFDPGETERLSIRPLWTHRPSDAQVPAHVDGMLRDARYVVIGDWYRRRGQHPSAPARAPMQHRFYDAMMSGQTGFRLVARFDNMPSFIDERGAEALAVDFDHMPVWIFERAGRYRSPF